MKDLVAKTFFVLICLICGSYMIACSVYYDSPIVDIFVTSDHRYNTGWLFLASSLMISFSMLGFIFLQFDVKHIICVILFCIPLLLVIPPMCMYAVYEMRYLPKVMEEEVIAKVTEHWKIHKKILPLLEYTQREQECCGLNGPTDYREYIFNLSSDSSCENERFDVPSSCCDLEHIYKQCKIKKKQEYCFIATDILENALIFTNNSLNLQLQNPKITIEEKRKLKCAHVTNETAILNTTGIRQDLIYSQGCMELILQNRRKLPNSNYAFFFILVLFSILVMALFINYWHANDKDYRIYVKEEKNDELKSGKNTQQTEDAKKLSLPVEKMIGIA